MTVSTSPAMQKFMDENPDKVTVNPTIVKAEEKTDEEKIVEVKVETNKGNEIKVDEKGNEIKTEKVESEDDIDAEYLKIYNKRNKTDFKSVKDIEDFSKKEDTPEEKTRKSQLEKADYISYYVEQGGKVDDVIAFENISQKSDEEIVKEMFSSQQRGKKKDITQDEIDTRFNRKYFRNTDEENPEYDEDFVIEGQEKIKNDANAERLRLGQNLAVAKQGYEAKKRRAGEEIAYRTKIESLLNSKESFEIPISDKENIPFAMTPERKAKVQEIMLATGMTQPDADVNTLYNVIVRGTFAEDMAKEAFKKGASKATERALDPFHNPIKETKIEAANNGKEGWMKDSTGKEFDPKTIGKPIAKVSRKH